MCGELQVASGFAALNVDDEGEPLDAAARESGSADATPAPEKLSPESKQNGKKVRPQAMQSG